MAGTYTYSGDPAISDADAVRFLVQDVGDLTPSGVQLWLLSDEEIAWLLDQWLDKYGSTLYVAAVAASVVATRFVGVVSVTTDGVSVNTSELSQRYRDLAADLRARYRDYGIGGEVDISNIMTGVGPDFSIRPLRFGIGLDDNPWAGLQDYGGWSYDPFADAQFVGPA